MRKNSLFLIIFISSIVMISGCSAAKPGTGTTSGVTSASSATSNTSAVTGTSNTSVDNGGNTTNKTGSGNMTGKAPAKEFSASEDMQLGSLKVDMPKNEIDKNITAKLTDTRKSEQYSIKTEILTYEDGTVIQLVDEKIYSIKVADASYATPRGLKVGDTEDKLKELYGEPDRKDEKGTWIYSAKGYDLFFVTIRDGVVKEIMVSQVM